MNKEPEPFYTGLTDEEIRVWFQSLDKDAKNSVLKITMMAQEFDGLDAMKAFHKAYCLWEKN
jgi:hypothetical protein